MVLLLAFAIVAGDEFYVFQEDVIIHPISFSIPQSFLVPEVPVKTAHLVNDTRNFQVKKYPGCSILVQNVCVFLLNLQGDKIRKYSQIRKFISRSKR